MFAARTESRQRFYTGKQVYIGDSHIMVVPTPRVTDPQNGPPPTQKNGLKSWGHSQSWGVGTPPPHGVAPREVGGRGPPPPVVAPLASHEVRSELDILVVLNKSVCFVTVSIGEISCSLLERLEDYCEWVAGLHP